MVSSFCLLPYLSGCFLWKRELYRITLCVNRIYIMFPYTLVVAFSGKKNIIYILHYCLLQNKF